MIEKGEIVNSYVHEYAAEPKPKFNEMQRLIETNLVVQLQKDHKL